jgi:hypothetical protein
VLRVSRPTITCRPADLYHSVGERPSRSIERRCVEDMAFRALAENQMPDHATIARFRATHTDALAGLFGHVLATCARARVPYDLSRTRHRLRLSEVGNKFSYESSMVQREL